jgi:hypothetical protein
MVRSRNDRVKPFNGRSSIWVPSQVIPNWLRCRGFVGTQWRWSWAGGMVMLHPDRCVAAWLRSGVPQLSANPDRPTIKPHALPDAALHVPLMCNLGTKEGVTVTDGQFAGVWAANESFFLQLRAQGGLVGVAIDPLTAHECGNQRYLAIPWLDACLSARLPHEAGESLNRCRLNLPGSHYRSPPKRRRPQTLRAIHCGLLGYRTHRWLGCGRTMSRYCGTRCNTATGTLQSAS